MTASTLMTKTKKDLVDLVLKGEKEVNRLTTKLNENTAQINELKGKVNSITKKYEEAVKANKNWDKIIRDKDEALKVGRNKVGHLNSVVEAKNNEIVNLNSKLTNKEKEIEKYKDDLKLCTESKNKYFGKVNDLLKEFTELQKLNEDFKNEIDDLTSGNVALINSVSNYKRIIWFITVIYVICCTLLIIY